MKSNRQVKLSGGLDAKHDGELREDELQTVEGGAASLYQACCTGKHIPEVVIH